MNFRVEEQLERERVARFVAEAEHDRLLHEWGLSAPSVGERLRGRFLGWAVAVHHHLHELDALERHTAARA